jgi:hypothetical protein
VMGLAGAAASGGSGSTVRTCGRGEARERERSGEQASSPPREASRVLVHQRGAAERWPGELPKLVNGGGDGGSGC